MSKVGIDLLKLNSDFWIKKYIDLFTTILSCKNSVTQRNKIFKTFKISTLTCFVEMLNYLLQRYSVVT